MEKNSSCQVSKKQQNNNYYNEVNDILKEFISYFVKEFESKLLAYHLFLEEEIKKAGKFSNTFSEKAGQGIGGVVGALAGLFLGSPGVGANLGAKAGTAGGKKLGSAVGNKDHKKKVVKLLDLIEFSQKNKANFRRELVEAGFDLFQSFEMQFMRVTTDEGHQKAIRQLAKDATNRAINYLKEEKNVSISESAILGESKKEEVYSISPGFEIQYKYQSSRKVWNTSNLYDKVEIVIEHKTSASYYKKKAGNSGATNYGYRRLLIRENWDKIQGKYVSDNIVESKSGQFTNYEYIINPRDVEEQSEKILGNLNSEDKNLAEDRIKIILEEVKKDILNEINVLKKQSHGYNEDRKILLNIEKNIKDLKLNKFLEKFKQRFEEFQQQLKKIERCIEQGRAENVKGHTKILEVVSEVNKKCDKLLQQETQTEGLISGLGIIKYYYISRKLNRRIQITKDIIKRPFQFFITYSSQVDESKFQRKQDIIIISNTREDFEQLCKKYKDHKIHWLKDKGSEFIWQHSQGCPGNLKIFLNNGEVQSCDIDTISSIEDKVVIISAGPGMGKSTLLTHVAIKQKMVSTSCKVIKINLNDHTEEISATDFGNTNNILEFFKAISNIKDLKQLKRSILLIDGFDEFASNPDYKQKILKLLKFLKDEVARLWITTRPYAKNDLEYELSIFSYTIEPLSEDAQKKFLEKFWKTNFIYDVIKELTLKISSELVDKNIKYLVGQVSKIIDLKIVEVKDDDYDDSYLKQIYHLTLNFNVCRKGELVEQITNVIDQQLGKRHKVSVQVKDLVENVVSGVTSLDEITDLIQKRVKSYAAKLIAKFSKSVSDKERECLGVPLQVRMLAEVFQEEVFEDIKSYTEPCLIEPKLPERLNLLDLYKRFIESRRRINFVEKGNMDLTLYNDSKEHFIKKHHLLSLALLFSEEDLTQLLSKQEKDKMKELNKRIADGMENTGIVYQIINGKPQFIHRTFAEYFTADFFVAKRMEMGEFLREYIFKAENKVIRHFFDRILTDDKAGENLYAIHMAVLNNDKDRVKDLVSDSQNTKNIVDTLDKGGRTALHLAASSDDLNIVEILLEQGASVNLKDQIFSWRPLRYADQCLGLSIMDLLLQKGASADDLVRTKQIIDKQEKDGFMLLWRACSGLTEFTKVLVEKLKVDVRTADDDGIIPLHIAAAFGELEIVKFLLNKDPSTANCKNKDGRTPLERAIIQNREEVIQYLGKVTKTTKQLKGLRLDFALLNHKIEVVKMLVEEKYVDVNFEILGWTLLHKAVIIRELKLVEFLLERGAKIDYKICECPTSLRETSENSRDDIVEYLKELLAEKKICTNLPNYDGCTPLHIATVNGPLDMLRCLVKEAKKIKVNIDIADHYGSTPLHCAASHGDFHSVQYLVATGANINAINKWGATVIINAACNDYFRTVNYLLHVNAKIDCDEGIIGKLGLTVLHFAALYGKSEIVKHLVKRENADVNAGLHCFTPLHLAAFADSPNNTIYLTENGAKVDVPINFANCAKIVKNEGKILKETNMGTFVEKLVHTLDDYTELVDVTPKYISEILRENSVTDKCRSPKEENFKKQIRYLRKVINDINNVKSILEPEIGLFDKIRSSRF